MSDHLEPVDPENWRATAEASREAGMSLLDVLAAVDRGETREVVLRLVDPTSGSARMIVTSVPSDDPRVASLADVIAGADWQEREAAEMFGLIFEGHPDPRPLLLRQVPDAPPLLAATALAERLIRTWPGAADPQEGRRPRRRQLPPGVRQEWTRSESEDPT